MKLTMWIFTDWLKKFHPKPDIRHNQFEIEAVRLFSPELTMEKNTMYIGRLCDLFTSKNRRVICVHNNDLLLLETQELEEVLNCVLDALAFYTSWDNSMMNLLTSGAMLQDLMNTSARVLEYPAFILDSGQRHLAHTPGYKRGEVDELWDNLVELGTCDLNFLVRFNQFDPQRFNKKGIYSYDSSIFPNPAYHYNFLQGSNFLGSATYIDLHKKITQGKLDLFYLFCHYVDRWFQLHITEQESLILNTQIRQTISDPGKDQEELIRRLILGGWEKEDSLIFYKLDAPYQPYNINTYLCHTLNSNFSGLYAITKDLSVCMLCNLSRISQNELENQLIPWLNTSKYYATAGQPFTMQSSFWQQYDYVDKISNLVEGQIGQIYNGKNYTLPYLFSVMKNTVLPEVLHPALNILQDYDARHHTDFFHTLYVYLKNERSIAASAKALNLHRNTLLYRLKRLDELTVENLDDPMTRLHILISYEIMEGHVSISP